MTRAKSVRRWLFTSFSYWTKPRASISKRKVTLHYFDSNSLSAPFRSLFGLFSHGHSAAACWPKARKDTRCVRSNNATDYWAEWPFQKKVFCSSKPHKRLLFFHSAWCQIDRMESARKTAFVWPFQPYIRFWENAFWENWTCKKTDIYIWLLKRS